MNKHSISRPPRPKQIARDKLKQRELAFVVNYCVTFKIQHSAIVAGFPPKGAHVQANRLLKKDTIQAAIREEMDDRMYDVRVNVNRVLHELAIVAFADYGDYIDFGDHGDVTLDLENMPEDASRAIQAIATKTIYSGSGKDRQAIRVVTRLKLHNKSHALERLGKYLQMFVEHRVDGGSDDRPLER